MTGPLGVTVEPVPDVGRVRIRLTQLDGSSMSGLATPGEAERIARRLLQAVAQLTTRGED